MVFQLEFHTFPSRSTSDNPHSNTHIRTTVDGLWCRASKQKAHLLNRAQSAAWQSQHRRGVYLKDTNRVRSLDRWIAVPQSFSPSVRPSVDRRLVSKPLLCSRCRDVWHSWPGRGTGWMWMWMYLRDGVGEFLSFGWRWRMGDGIGNGNGMGSLQRLCRLPLSYYYFCLRRRLDDLLPLMPDVIVVVLST